MRNEDRSAWDSTAHQRLCLCLFDMVIPAISFVSVISPYRWYEVQIGIIAIVPTLKLLACNTLLSISLIHFDESSLDSHEVSPLNWTNAFHKPCTFRCVTSSLISDHNYSHSSGQRVRGVKECNTLTTHTQNGEEICVHDKSRCALKTRAVVARWEIEGKFLLQWTNVEPVSTVTEAQFILRLCKNTDDSRNFILPLHFHCTIMKI